MNSPNPPLHGQLVLVTGGLRGIGLAISNTLSAAGARVLATSRDCPSLPKNLPEPGQTALAPLDVASESSVLKLFEWIDAQRQPLRALVNNAGVGVFKPLLETTRTEFETCLSTNLTGSFLCMREAGRRMLAQRQGRVLQIGSISDHLMLSENGAYAASKFGVRALVGIFNEEFKNHGVFASLISPGAALTEIWKGREGFDPSDMIPPEEIARSVLDILSRPSNVRIDEIKILPPRGVL